MLKRGSFTLQVVWGLSANAKKFLYIVHLEIKPSKKKDHRHIKKQKIEVYKKSARSKTKSQASATCFFSKQDSLN